MRTFADLVILGHWHEGTLDRDLCAVLADNNAVSHRPVAHRGRSSTPPAAAKNETDPSPSKETAMTTARVAKTTLLATITAALATLGTAATLLTAPQAAKPAVAAIGHTGQDMVHSGPDIAHQLSSPDAKI